MGRIKEKIDVNNIIELDNRIKREGGRYVMQEEGACERHVCEDLFDPRARAKCAVSSSMRDMLEETLNAKANITWLTWNSRNKIRERGACQVTVVPGLFREKFRILEIIGVS